MRNLMLVVFALVLMSSVSFAQLGNSSGAGTGFGEVIVNVGGNLDVAFTGADWGDPPLAAGVTYTVDPINGFITPDPVPGGNTVLAPMQLDLGGDAFLNVDVTFTLPTALVGVNSGYRIGISFNSQSAYWLEGSQVLNPNNTFTVSTGAGNLASIALGATISVPANAAADEYHGEVVVLCQISGL